MAPQLPPSSYQPSNASHASSDDLHKDERSIEKSARIDEDPTQRTDANILAQVESNAAGTKADPEKTPQAPPAFDPSQFPDGGLKAWLVVVGAFCCLFCSFGWINCIGVFQEYYQSNMLSNLSPSTVSWIVSLEAFMMFFGGPFIGRFYDNFGPRHLIAVGTFLHVFGLMMTSLSTKYYQFILAQGICSPLGASMIFFPAMSSVTTWFFQRRALAFGIVASGSSLGGVIFPIMTQRLIPEVGFGWAMRISAFLILFLMIIANLTVVSRLPPRRTPFVVKDFITPYAELPFSLTAAGLFFTFMGLFLPINYIIVQALREGMSANLASYLVPILNALSLFGRVLPGYAGDKLGRYNVLIVLSYFTAIIVLALWMTAHGNAAIIVFTALYGFGSGAFVSMAPALIAQISDVRQIGTRTGAVFAIVGIAALIGNPIGGALLDRWNGSFTGLQIYCGVMMLAGACFIAAARYSLQGFKVVKV